LWLVDCPLILKMSKQREYEEKRKHTECAQIHF
jgi:hypothetical protein